MAKRPFEGILTALVPGVTNARGEAVNAKIQSINAPPAAYETENVFRNAICLHLGGLDLYPKISRT